MSLLQVTGKGSYDILFSPKVTFRMNCTFCPEGADDEVFQVALSEVIDKMVQQDDESARKGRRDVADDDEGKDQNQSPKVAYQRHKLPAEAHDGRRDDGVQPPVAQEVVEGVLGVFQTALRER